jgi:hypothetical protein
MCNICITCIISGLGRSDVLRQYQATGSFLLVKLPRSFLARRYHDVYTEPAEQALNLDIIKQQCR